jgi:hypothetical protein
MQFHSVVTNQIELNQKKNKKDKKVPKQWKRKKLRMSQNIIVMISMMKIVYWSEKWDWKKEMTYRVSHSLATREEEAKTGWWVCVCVYQKVISSAAKRWIEYVSCD